MYMYLLIESYQAMGKIKRPWIYEIHNAFKSDTIIFIIGFVFENAIKIKNAHEGKSECFMN